MWNLFHDFGLFIKLCEVKKLKSNFLDDFRFLFNSVKIKSMRNFK